MIETFKQKIFGTDAMSMYNILRNSGKISFANDVNGLKVTKIIDGETGKYVLPDGKYDYIPMNQRGLYFKVFLEDGSDYIITIDQSTNSLIFNFNTSIEKLAGLRETILSFIDYDYGKDKGS